LFKGKNLKQEKKFIRDVEDALVETAKEADRQRSFKEREAETLKHRLQSNKVEADLVINRRLQDNSNLLFECNELRKYGLFFSMSIITAVYILTEK